MQEHDSILFHNGIVFPKPLAVFTSLAKGEALFQESRWMSLFPLRLIIRRWLRLLEHFRSGFAEFEIRLVCLFASFFRTTINVIGIFLPWNVPEIADQV